MADDLKRVGLVFKADGTTDFAKSLTTINSLTQENYANFKLAQSQYDKTTSSLTKLKDQQSYLAQNTELYKNKVAVLEEQLNELENAEDRNEKAISSKKKQLANAQTTLNNYEKGLKEVNDQLESGSAQLKEYADKVADASDKISSAGKSLTKNVTAPIVAIGTASMVAWNEIDEAYDNITAKTGKTGETLEGLQKTFDNVFGSMPVEASDVSNAIAELNTRFGFTDETLENASKSFLKFAQVNDTDVASAVSLVSRAMGDAGIESTEYQRVLDSLTTASQSSGIAIDSLAESLTSYGAPMRALGFDMESSIALFAQWEKAGVNTKIAFSGMKTAISNWSKEGKDARVEFSKTLDEIAKCPTLAEATTKAIEVFGSKAGPDLADAIQGGRFSIEEMNKVLANSSGSVEQSFNAMLDPVDKAKEAFNNIKLVGADLADTIQGALAPVLEKISVLLKNFADWFKNLNPAIKETIVVIAGIVASIGPLIVVIGAVGTQISKGLKILSKLKLMLFQEGGAFNMLQGAISGLTGPMIAIIGVIALVTVAIVDLWKNNEGFRKNVIDIVNNIMSIVQNFYNNVLKPIIDAIVEIIKALWDECLKPLYENVKSFIAEVINIVSGFLAFLTPIINVIVNLLGVILKNVLQNVILPVFKTVFSAIGTVVNTAFNLISSIYNSILKPCFDALVSLIKNVLMPAFSTTFNTIKNVISTCFNGIKSVYNSILKPCFSTISSAIKTLKSTFSSVFNSIKSTTSTIFNGIKNAMTSPIETAKNMIKKIVDTVKGFFNFKISFPKVPMPHFSITPKGWGIGDLLKGSIPKLGISWYAKAMNTPMILDAPTIFGMQNGNLLGGGEAGSEVVSGTNTLMNMISQAVSQNNARYNELLEKILSILALYLPLLNDKDLNTYLDGDILAMKLAPKMDRELGVISKMKERGR